MTIIDFYFFFEILILILKSLTLNLKNLKIHLNVKTISMRNDINDRSKFDKKSFDFFDTSTILNCEFLFLFCFFVHVFINSKSNCVFDDILNQISYATIFLDIVEYWFEKQIVKFHCVLITNVVHEWCYMIDIVSIFFVRCFIREFYQFKSFFIENSCLHYFDIIITNYKFILFCKTISFETLWSNRFFFCRIHSDFEDREHRRLMRKTREFVISRNLQIRYLVTIYHLYCCFFFAV